MILNGDSFAPTLRQFLDTGYKFERGYPDDTNNPEPQNPLLFYNRHVASTLLLKNVRRAPWIPTDLSKICEDAIREFTMAGHTFVDNLHYRGIFREDYIYNGRCSGVADYHFDRVSKPCNAYASKLLFTPEDPAWFSFIVSRRDRSTRAQYSFRCAGDTAIIKPKKEDLGNKEYNIPPERRSTLDHGALQKINKLRDKKSIFNYEFFIKAEAGEALLRKMNCWGTFKWDMPTATGAPELPLLPPHRDSPIIQTLFPSLYTTTPRPLSTRKGSPSTKSGRIRRKLVAPLRNAQRDESKYRINAHHYIQKGWANAVESDVTFILFTCGKLERIAIRHRQSQTLYLSDLIDPMRTPGYRQIHLGLTIAAIKDRLAMLDQEELSNQRPLKRKTPPPQNPIVYNSMKDKATRRKRRKLDPELELTSEGMDKKAAPSTFWRMEPSCALRPFQNHSYRFKRKASYPPEGYISVITHEDDIGSGAMGMVYRVAVEIEMNDGSKHQRTLILKLAIGPKKDQIIQEYEMYKRLAEADVTYGIVGVHGLFHDMESDAMLLIMEDAGKSLRTRATEHNLKIHYSWDDSLVEATEEERDAFVKALKGIHSAHVLHQDLRIDNLMINDAGDVFIIDFDNAEYYTLQHPRNYREEMGELLSVIGWLDSDDEESDDDSEDEDEDENKNDGEEDGDEG
ncbi:Serine/threonine-protein kinase pak-1 [Psilocybe cubensis]|uniref:Protein kinase domain-containing protein n=2 Tax=Psilocybe cubensis TaxID=181762 RepID=A0A8H7XUI6_PSICU|nr:Serine/threonine-protein kinase pak-1 [Psilocybe cubensis]KAH9474862.1 Serine/threonine-protein kinase pak-1 [Psilocybe cubensis]